MSIRIEKLFAYAELDLIVKVLAVAMNSRIYDAASGVMKLCLRGFLGVFRLTSSTRPTCIPPGRGGRAIVKMWPCRR
jgi:hypothetical protein